MIEEGFGPQRVRLVHLQLLPMLSGVQKVTLDEFSQLDIKRFAPTLICKEPGQLVEAVSALGVKCEFVPDLAREISPVKDMRAIVSLVKCLRRVRPDVIHTHSSKTGILGRLAAYIAGVPKVIHTVHGFAFPFAKSRFTRGFYFIAEYIGGLLSDAVVVLNVTDYNYAVKKLRIPEHKVHLIPNGVHLDTFGRITGEARENYRKEILRVKSGDEICIAMVGRLWAQKNPLCLVEAARKVLESTDKPIKFVFVGDGELRAEMETRIETYKLTGKVEVLGWRSDVPALLSCVDMFVLPSLWEGMPLAILEAMASNLPTVVSDIPGNNDLVHHDVDGLLFRADDSADLAQQLKRLIDDQSLRERLATAARAKVTTKYSLAQRMTQITSLYNEGDLVVDGNLDERSELSY